MDKKTAGAWIIHHTHKLENAFDSDQFGRIRLAGKCGILLSALSTNEATSLDNKRISTLATAAGIDPTFQLDRVLGQLEAQHLIERNKNGIEVLGLTTPIVLQHTCDLFASLSKTDEELAVIALAEICSRAPTESATLAEQLADKFKLASAKVGALLQTSTEIGFTDCEDVDSTTKLYFNGNLFRNNDLKKVQAVLESLSPPETRKVNEANELLRKRGCLTGDELTKLLGDVLFKKLHSIGLFDVSVVSNSKESVAFVTRPSAFAKYGNASDAFDNAKALVSAISYGIHRSYHARGQIRMVERLLRKMINGGTVGPATAIGEDYKILEMKHVVQVTPDGGLYSMRLLKREVGELALQVLEDGDASEQSLPQFPGASVTQFQAPEEQRVRVRQNRKKSLPASQIADLLQNLRSDQG